MTKAIHAGRAGGLAFAFGAGLAIATATAASAWASPADTDSPAAGHAAVAHSSVRGTHGSPAARTTSQGSNTLPDKAITLPARTARPTPAATRTPVRNPAPAVQAPAPAAARPTVAALAPTTTAVDTPVARAVGFAGPFANHQMTITILPKFPLGLPPVTIPFVKHVNGFATFTPKSVYDLHSVDQYDWNKLTGISFSIPGDVNSSMVAWRYNVTSGEFEVAPFFNVDRVRILPEPAYILSVPIGETFDFAVDYDGISITVGDQTVYKATPEGLTPNFWTSYRVSVWFGGTSLPPKLIQLKLRVRSC